MPVPTWLLLTAEKRNGSEDPEPFKNRGAEALCPSSVFAGQRAKSSYLERIKATDGTYPALCPSADPKNK